MSAVLKLVAPAQRPRTPGWVVLIIDDMKLAVPQRDVRTIEVVSALQAATDGETAPSWLAHGDGRWRAYALDAQLALQPSSKSRRRFCVFLHDVDTPRGLLCDQVSLLVADADLVIEPIPASLIDRESPVRWAGLGAGQMLAATRGDLLIAYLSRLDKNHGE